MYSENYSCTLIYPLMEPLNRKAMSSRYSKRHKDWTKTTTKTVMESFTAFIQEFDKLHLLELR